MPLVCDAGVINCTSCYKVDGARQVQYHAEEKARLLFSKPYSAHDRLERGGCCEPAQPEQNGEQAVPSLCLKEVKMIRVGLIELFDCLREATEAMEKRLNGAEDQAEKESLSFAVLVIDKITIETQDLADILKKALNIEDKKYKRDQGRERQGD
jgi:hypothetical protein